MLVGSLFRRRSVRRCFERGAERADACGAGVPVRGDTGAVFDDRHRVTDADALAHDGFTRHCETDHEDVHQSSTPGMLM